MTYLIREARHVGLALGLDSVRYYSIDIDIRHLSDFIILKSQGMNGLSSDLEWLYSVFEPHIIRNMPRQFFVILSKEGSIGLGEFKEIPWHKQEKENILKAVCVSVEYGEPIEKGEYRGTHVTVGDKEHPEIIRLYIKEDLSMNKIAEKLGRSSRVPFKHIHQHNSKVEGAGFCPACRRVKSGLDKTLARRVSFFHSSNVCGGASANPFFFGYRSLEAIWIRLLPEENDRSNCLKNKQISLENKQISLENKRKS